MGISALVILAATVWPILSYELNAREKYPILVSSRIDGASEILEDLDYTHASNWIPSQGKDAFADQNASFFTLSIPKLGIDNATVAVGGEDLSESLILFPGTALPGKRGNAVIFGHSILPLYYDPKDYLAIFSTIDRLEKGDEVYINYDGISYVYSVKDMFEVKPTDIEILEQNLDGSYLSLVTCSPMGHPFKPKRLIVRAKISSDSNQANAATRN